MKLLRQTSDNCFLYAAAMVLDISPEALEKLIGHNGEEIWWPEQPGCKKKRAFHPQEILDAAKTLGYTFIDIELMPQSGWGECDARSIFTEERMVSRFEQWITGRSAMILTRCKNELFHMVAWDGKIIYDPKGFLGCIEEYTIISAFILMKMI